VKFLTRDYDYYFNKLNKYFRLEFNKASKVISLDKINYYIPEFYIKWLYSSSRDHNLISPANLFLLLDEIYFDDLNNNNKDFIYMSCIKKFNLDLDLDNNKNKINNKKQKIIIKPEVYYLDDHPVVRDLRYIINNFYDDIDIFDLKLSLDLNNKHVKKILLNLSLYDPNYLEFLKIICVELNIFESMTCINCERLKLSDSYQDLLSLSNQDLFNKIFEASLNLFYKNICNLLGLDIISQDDYKFLLKIFYMSNKSINKIINLIFDHFKLTKDSFIKINNHNMIQEAIYFLNIILNRFFSITLGHYLKLINPVYLKEFNLSLNILLTKKLKEFNKDIFNALDYSETSFILTSLGYKFFKANNFNLNKKNLSQEEVFYLINNFKSKDLVINNNKFNLNFNQANLESYLIKIQVLDNNKIFRALEIRSIMTLRDLYKIILKEFDLLNLNHESINSNQDYNFYLDINNSNQKLDLDLKLNNSNLDLINTKNLYLIINHELNKFSRDNKLIKNNICFEIYIHQKNLELANLFLDYKIIF
jgi:hypothetical protein